MKPITHPLAIAYLERWVTDAGHDQQFAAWESAGYPLYADATEPLPNTVRVRVLVNVATTGAWSAAGGSNPDYDPTEGVDHAPGDRLVWLVQDVPLPEPAAEIVAEIEP